jgi:hypothetical protein
MSDLTLGSLERIDARDVWKNEAYDFTPWLRENVHLLGQAVGLELDVEVQQEIAVGLFSADLLGTDLGSSARVLIENQLEQTNHSHLGQLLTYAGGLQTDILIWVAPRIREEHRQALIWLNEHTLEDVLFFGVEIELLRIDGSLPAPHFKLVVAPNEWQKTQTARASKATVSGPTAKQEKYRQFWSDTIRAILERERTFTTTNPERAPRQNWCSFSAGRTGFLNSMSFGYEDAAYILRSELYIDTGDKGQNKAAFDLLEAQRGGIDEEVGEPLNWTRRDDIRASRVYMRRAGSIEDDAAWPEFRDWFVKRAFAIRDAFAPRVKALALPPPGSADPDE